MHSKNYSWVFQVAEENVQKIVDFDCNNSKNSIPLDATIKLGML